MNGDDLSEMGPIDYLLVEWPGRQPNGEVAPHLVDLVDRGLIRILDLAFIAKAEDGSVAGLEIADLGGEVAELAVFEGASSGLLSDEDIGEAGGALEPGTSAALLVFENTWAAPFAERRPPLRRPARRQRPHPRPSRPRRPRRGRGRRLREGDDHARTTSRRRPHRRHRRHRDHRQQPRLPPPGPALGPAGSPAGAPAAGPRAAPAPAPPAGESTIDQLKELGELKSQGILTEEEFAAQKAKLLGSSGGGPSPERVLGSCSATVSSAVGLTSRRPSGIGSPLRIERP